MIKERDTSHDKNLKEKEVKYLSHGTLGHEKDWKQPKLVAKSEELSRPGYSSIKAN